MPNKPNTSVRVYYIFTKLSKGIKTPAASFTDEQDKILYKEDQEGDHVRVTSLIKRGSENCYKLWEKGDELIYYTTITNRETLEKKVICGGGSGVIVREIEVIDLQTYKTIVTQLEEAIQQYAETVRGIDSRYDLLFDNLKKQLEDLRLQKEKERENIKIGYLEKGVNLVRQDDIFTRNSVLLHYLKNYSK